MKYDVAPHDGDTEELFDDRVYYVRLWSLLGIRSPSMHPSISTSFTHVHPWMTYQEDMSVRGVLRVSMYTCIVFLLYKGFPAYLSYVYVLYILPLAPCEYKLHFPNTVSEPEVSTACCNLCSQSYFSDRVFSPHQILDCQCDPEQRESESSKLDKCTANNH